jgi:hypothetical protein
VPLPSFNGVPVAGAVVAGAVVAGAVVAGAVVAGAVVAGAVVAGGVPSGMELGAVGSEAPALRMTGWGVMGLAGDGLGLTRSDTAGTDLTPTAVAPVDATLIVVTLTASVFVTSAGPRAGPPFPFGPVVALARAAALARTAGPLSPVAACRAPLRATSARPSSAWLSALAMFVRPLGANKVYSKIERPPTAIGGISLCELVIAGQSTMPESSAVHAHSMSTAGRWPWPSLISRW